MKTNSKLLPSKSTVSPRSGRSISPDGTTDKTLVLAIQRHGDKTVVTPIDIEHDVDDQTPLTVAEEAKRKAAQDFLFAHETTIHKAFECLHTLFSGRLTRDKFSSFQNYCFALLGMCLPDEKLAKIKARLSQLKPITNKGQEERV